jgi:translation initiation factor 4G
MFYLYFNSILGYGTDSKLNGETLKKWTEVLSRYVKNIADRELQVLFAVQTLVTQLQHPKGFFFPPLFKLSF